jgi:peroxiredoxin
MDDALVLIRLGLAAVFLVAGVAKLRDRPGSRQALVDFGVSDRAAAPLHLVLPATEIVTAVALLFAPTAQLGAGASLILLGAFIAGLTRVLRRGEAPDCHCFGQVHSEPASWLTVARNAGFAVAAAFVLAGGGGPALTAWVDARDAQQLALIGTSTLAGIASLAYLVLWRENRRLRTTQAPVAPKPLRIGARAPRFSLPSVDGFPVTLEDLLVAGQPCMLTFVAAGCAPCAALLPEITRWRETFAEHLVLPVISAGGADAAGVLATQFGLTQVLVDESSAVSRAYGVPGTPCAVLVAPDGTVTSAPAPGHGAIEALVRVALEGAPAPPDLALHQVR